MTKEITYLLNVIVTNLLQAVLKCQLNLNKSTIYSSTALNILGFNIKDTAKISQHKFTSLQKPPDNLSYRRNYRALSRFMGHSESIHNATNYDKEINKQLYLAFKQNNYRQKINFCNILNLTKLHIENIKTPFTTLFINALKPFITCCVMINNNNILIKQYKYSLHHCPAFHAEKLSLMKALQFINIERDIDKSLLIFVENQALALASPNDNYHDRAFEKILHT